MYSWNISGEHCLDFTSRAGRRGGVIYVCNVAIARKKHRMRAGLKRLVKSAQHYHFHNRSIYNFATIVPFVVIPTYLPWP